MLDFIVSNASIIGLLFFFSCFLIIGVYALRPKNKKKFEEYGQIPLKNRK